ncbi:MAG TPA: glycoside hydrolase family 3 C-terminal domain-containing protein [bacterium]|nr:glycoside hydrolase family 3 C-terminal domain-containing protein [bacterium]
MKRSLKSTGLRNAYCILVALFTFVILAAPFCCVAQAEETPLYKDQNAPIDKRVEDLIGRMTLEEKIDMVSGDMKTGFNSLANERLGIPEFTMADGPHGIRWGEATCFPTGVGIGATWNEDLAELVGQTMARDALSKGRNVILGPCINIHRVPFGGRNFESYGEDPFLSGRLAVGYVKGVQEYGVIATPKHYAVNNQEYERMTISTEISERALREIYLPHFKVAVQEADAWSIMCSYNRINSIYACENKHLLTDILKDEWGFNGFVMSDWGAVHSTIETAMSGMDIEMPNGKYLGKDLLKAVKEGKVPESQVENMVRNILRVMMVSGIFDHRIEVDGAWEDSPANRAAALQVAREAIVLLKNEGAVLPLDKNKIKSIAVIGQHAATLQTGGGGSSWVTPSYKVSPLEGIAKEAGTDIEVRYIEGSDTHLKLNYEVIPTTYLTPKNDIKGEFGVRAEYFNGKFEGDPVETRIDKKIDFNWGTGDRLIDGMNNDNFSVRWEGSITPKVSGKYKIFAIANDGIAQLYIDGKAKINNMAFNGTTNGKSTTVKFEAGRKYDLKLEYQGMGNRSMVRLGWIGPGINPLKQAAETAAASDVAVVFVGLDKTIEGEGNDRENIELTGLQNEMVQAVAKANPKTIVVMFNGTPFIIDSWKDKVPAILEAWYPGQEGGRAVAEILFGDVNPSGKMPLSYPESWEKSPAYDNYPGKDGKVFYDEGIFIGYRYYDEKGLEPVFPFGHGLSYSSFEYSNLSLSKSTLSSSDKLQITLSIKNAGKLGGKEAVQLYINDVEASVPRPPKELKGISKVYILPGETKEITFTIDSSALSFFDEKTMKWVAEPGEFEVQIGSSSRDIRLKKKFELK